MKIKGMTLKPSANMVMCQLSRLDCSPKYADTFGFCTLKHTETSVWVFFRFPFILLIASIRKTSIKALKSDRPIWLYLLGGDYIRSKSTLSSVPFQVHRKNINFRVLSNFVVRFCAANRFVFRMRFFASGRFNEEQLSKFSSKFERDATRRTWQSNKAIRSIVRWTRRALAFPPKRHWHQPTWP